MDFISKGRRFSSMLIDLITILVVNIVCIAIAGEYQSYPIVLHNTTHYVFLHLNGFLVAALVGIFLFKDAIDGRSIGKRLCKLQVVSQNGEKASVFQLIIRGLFIALGPVELIYILTYPNMRIGDKIAKTEIVNYDFGQRKRTFDYIRLLYLFVFIVFFGAIITAQRWVTNKNNVRTDFYEFSYDKNMSVDITLKLDSALGNSYSSSVRAYDSTKYTGTSYVSIIIKYERIEDIDIKNRRFVHAIADSICKLRFNRHFVGQIQNWYQDDHNFILWVDNFK